jgi:biotin synthase
MILINPNIQETDKFTNKDDLNLDFDSIKGGDLRHDWSLEEVKKILDLPLMDLLWRAQIVHRSYNPGYKVQLASLLSVKTGGCSEDCSYCPQSVHNETRVQPIPALQVKSVLDRARAAKDAGADRFCMGWAWREIKDGNAFDSMLEMIRGVRELGLEVLE